MLVRIFLGGDVMTGRGIDQIMAHPGDPALYEPVAKSALRYVELAEQRNGRIPRTVEPSYVWGEALDVLDDAGVDVRIVNLETAVTDRGDPWPGKGIHYRMHPDNVEAISAGSIDCCVLANNHVLDWSSPGLEHTLSKLEAAGLMTAGAGEDITRAATPATIDADSGARVVVVALGAASSGIPLSWSAGPNRAGVLFVDSLSDKEVEAVARTVRAASGPTDIVVVSIHWGPNWGYGIPTSHRRFAHRLIDHAGAHIVHGHSSHHPLGIEVYRDRLILYGCGDLINDYEGIGGHEEFHPDLAPLYLATVDSSSGSLERLELTPMRMRRFRLEHAPTREVGWLADVLSRESRRFGVTATHGTDDRIAIRW